MNKNEKKQIHANQAFGHILIARLTIVFVHCFSAIIVAIICDQICIFLHIIQLVDILASSQISTFSSRNFLDLV